MASFDYMQWVDRNWGLLSRLMRGHAALYRATNGWLGHRVPGFAPMLLLDHVGARSNVRRTTPLLYGEDGENVVIVASKGGYPKNPAWFYNLGAHPDTTIQVGRERRAVHARVAEPAERQRLWDMMVSVYGGYRAYQKRTEREIPIVVLEPR